jgi:hypothetical protein
MKEEIKILLRENLLLIERLTNVDSDVDLIYNRFFKNDVDEIKRTNMVNREMFSVDDMSTSELKSTESINANKINKCNIIINYPNKGNFYQPKKSLISLSINQGALEYALDNNGSLKLAHSHLYGNKANTFLKEFSEERIKGSIHHELVHWIDDTINNSHIYKSLKKTEEKKLKMVYRNIPIDASTMEIQAQIHNIKQYYNKHKDIWDTLSFNDIINSVLTINVVYNKLHGNVRIEWLKRLKKRMAREGLLGDNMR